MNVAWTTLNGSTVESRSWEVNAWEFGPAPVLKVYNSSGGEVGAGAGGFEVAVERGIPVWGGEDVDNDPSYISYISTGIYESKPQNLLPLLFLLTLTSSQGNTGVVIAAVAIVAGAGVATLIYWRKRR